MERHRRVLLGGSGASDFFIKTVTRITSTPPKSEIFYEASKLVIQYRRGVIKELLPHGPHNVIDVLATRVPQPNRTCEQVLRYSGQAGIGLPSTLGLFCFRIGLRSRQRCWTGYKSCKSC